MRIGKHTAPCIGAVVVLVDICDTAARIIDRPVHTTHVFALHDFYTLARAARGAADEPW